MPRPSPADSIDASHDLQQRLNTITSTTTSIPPTNLPLIINNHATTDDLAHNNLNASLFSSTATRLIQHQSLPTTLADKTTSTIHLLSRQQLNNNSIISSPNSISNYRNTPIQLNNHPSSIKTITTPLISSIQSLRTVSNTRPLMKDQSIQCIDDNQNSTADGAPIIKSSFDISRHGLFCRIMRILFSLDNLSKKRNRQSQEDSSPIDETWTAAADT